MQNNKKIGVFIAVLAYDGRVDALTSQSLMANAIDLQSRGDYNLAYTFESGCCYLPRARNNCVQSFLETGLDYLIFVDSDLYFQDDAMHKLLSHKKDIVGGAYPYRGGAGGWPVRPIKDKNDNVVIDNYSGLIECEGVPTGLMCIHRNVFINMLAKHPEYISDQIDNGKRIFYIFDTGMLWENKKHWYGEDYLFCLRAKKDGYKIYCEPNINFEHIGKEGRQGNYKKYLISLKHKKEGTN